MTDANAERGYTITRVYDAPRELVWDAWTIADQFGEWFGGPTAEMKNMKMDATPNGQWSGTMIVQGGYEINWSGFFIELDKPNQLKMGFSDEPIVGDRYDIFTVTLKDLGGNRTEMTLRQSGGHLTDEQYEQAKEGTAGFLDYLGELLAKQQ